MKISTYHKQKGDVVGFNISDPDIVYASIVFSKNKWKGDGIKQMYPGVEVHVGGSGYDLKGKLPEYIEHIMPDYDLYGLDYSMGFTSRGCIRKCKFCIVPKKEGYIRSNCSIYEFWDSKHKHIMLLDNNILALSDHFNVIAHQILSENLTVDFNQGLDIRLINDGNAEVLSKLKVKPEYRFAFDDIKLEATIRKKVDILKRHGIKRGFFYVLVGFNSTFEEDMHRINVLKELDQRAFVMKYETVVGKQPYTDFARWVNARQLFRTVSFERFREVEHKGLSWRRT